jgi:hypothetical protein
MRQGSNPRRSRGRGPRKPHNPSRPQNFDNPGPDVRVRGNTYQVMEKYLALARDASLAGDRIAMENYLQHAEHYYRTINANGDGNRPRPPVRNDGQGGADNGQGGNVQGPNGQDGNVAGANGYDAQPDGDTPRGENGPGEARPQHPGQLKATAAGDPADDTDD